MARKELTAETIEEDLEAIQEIRTRWMNVGQSEITDNLAFASNKMTDVLKNKLFQDFKDRPRSKRG